MTSAEFELLFYNALKLLHSKSKNSVLQLKAILDDVLSKNEKKADAKLLESKVKETTKRPAKPPPENVMTKKLKLISSPVVQKEPPTKIKITPPSEEQAQANKRETDSDATDVEEESTDAGEFAIEYGLACVVCKQIDFVPGNQPVECSECHNLYHQECHKPPITDVSDPRNVWYCAKCTKNLEKLAKKTAKVANKSPILTNSASFQYAINTGRETAIQLIKAKAEEMMLKNSSSSSNSIQPFKRAEPKIPQSPSSSSNSNPLTSSKPVGLAGFAANLTRTTGSTSSTTTTSTTLSPVTPANSNNSLFKADKRIRQMKKKAEAKKSFNK